MSSLYSWKELHRYLDRGEKFDRHKKELTNELIDACLKGEESRIKMLIREGAFIDSDDGSINPLMACIEGGNLEIARILLMINADPTSMVKNNDATWMALKQNKIDFLKIFFEKKLLLNREIGSNKTLLMLAVEKSNLEAVKIIAYNVNVNEKDNEGNTALHYNMRKKNPNDQDREIGRILLSLGAMGDNSNNEGQSAREIASEENESIFIEHDIDHTLPKPQSVKYNKNKI